MSTGSVILAKRHTRKGKSMLNRLHLKYKQYQIWCPQNRRNCWLELEYGENLFSYDSKCWFRMLPHCICNLLNFPSIKLRINHQYFCQKSIKDCFKTLFMSRHCSWWIQILPPGEYSWSGSAAGPTGRTFILFPPVKIFLMWQKTQMIHMSVVNKKILDLLNVCDYD